METWLNGAGRHQITSPELSAAALAMAPKARFSAPAISWALAALITCATAIYVGMTQGDPKNILFTLSVIGTIGALGTVIAQRILLASFSFSVLVALVSVIAYLKQQKTDVTLHAFDAVSLLTSQTALDHLWRDQHACVVAIAAALLTTLVLGWAAYKLDGSRVRRRHAAVGAALFGSLAWVGADAQEARRHMGFYYEERRLWFFFSSWLETTEALWRGHLIEAAPQQSRPALTVPTGCNPESKPPHIILIHQESVVPPSHFPSLTYDKRVDALFRSHDDQIHKLRVETYGGASWLTEFSVLTGLSASSFGHLRQFAQTIMAGKVRETLPQALARCGYRNVAFHPMLRIYLSIGNFLKAVGVHQVFDATDQRAKTATERDRFYYSNALAEMERHFQTSNQPLFTFIETMATHGPYSYSYMPEVLVAGGGPGTDPQMHEYLRRLSMAHMDYEFLRAEIARRFPDESFLIIHYGDHQPTATRALLGFGQKADIEQVLGSGNPAALVTYYAVDGVRYRPPSPPTLEMLDVPYLPSVILDAAGLPLPDSHRERLRLMTLCEGRYHGCPEIPEFHRRLIDSGIIDAW